MASYPHEKAGQPGSHSLPHRQAESFVSDDDAVPDTDPSEVKRQH